MQLKNDLNIGLGIGIILPIVVFFCLFGANEAFHLPFKMRTIALIALFINTIPIQRFGKTKMLKLSRGAVIATFILCIVWLIWFLPEIISHELWAMSYEPIN